MRRFFLGGDGKAKSGQKTPWPAATTAADRPHGDPLGAAVQQPGVGADAPRQPGTGSPPVDPNVGAAGASGLDPAPGAGGSSGAGAPGGTSPEAESASWMPPGEEAWPAQDEPAPLTGSAPQAAPASEPPASEARAGEAPASEAPVSDGPAGEEAGRSSFRGFVPGGSGAGGGDPQAEQEHPVEPTRSEAAATNGHGGSDGQAAGEERGPQADGGEREAQAGGEDQAARAGGGDEGAPSSSDDLARSAVEKRDERPALPEEPELPDDYEPGAGSDSEPTHALPAVGSAPSQSNPEGSRVSVVDEAPPRPAPPDGASDEEYKWHTYRVYPSGRPDAVEFIDTYKAFGKARILRGLNMGLPEGMVSMILGPSGTGKSVCIKHMVGLLYPDQGDILVHGQSVPNMADDDLFEMRKKFGLLFQDGALFGSMNLFDNVCFPLRQHTEKSEKEIEEIVMRRLNEVGLGSAREKMPNELSGGMRKRAGFARALVLEPDIVLFDEPDSGLDPVRTALLGELILEIHRDMMDEAKEKQREHLPTFAVITHDIMSARRVADYINVLWRGRIVEAGPAEDMLNSDNPFIRQFLAGESQGPLSMD